MNDRDNDHVTLQDLRGFSSDTLIGSCKETEAISKGTRCKQPFFSISLNPPKDQDVSHEVFEEALSRIEAKLGLKDQPRAIVYHEKEARRHCHAVYSRIDADSMTAINMAHFKLKLRDISRELYLENEWRLPDGLMNSEAKDPRNYTLAEYQQAKRMGRDARDLKQTMIECWAASDGKAAFENALSERGLILAKGDRRGHVVVTHEGEILSVSRYIGKKAKEVRTKLGEPDGLPSIETAKADMAKDMYSAFGRHIHEAKRQHQIALAPLDTKRRAMTGQHREERRKLAERQRARWDEENRLRAQRLNKGLRGVWDKLTGVHSRMEKQNIAEAHAALKRDERQRHALMKAQLEDRQALREDMKELRVQLATFLRELRTDRCHHVPDRSNVAGRATTRVAPSHQIAAASSRPEPPGLAKTFERAAKPPIQNRLSRLREKERVQYCQRERGHDLDR